MPGVNCSRQYSLNSDWYHTVTLIGGTLKILLDGRTFSVLDAISHASSCKNWLPKAHTRILKKTCINLCKLI